MLDDIFEAQIGFVAGEGKPGAVAMVKRHGIMTVRTVMVLCGYRIMEAGWVPILKRMPSRFAYSEFDTAVRNAGFGVCAAKRALKKYVASGLLSKSNGFHFKTSRLK